MTSSAITATGTKPTLHTGDRMSPEEFDRIYADLHDVRAELIDGVVYVASPVRIMGHADAHHIISGLVFLYRSNHPGVHSFSDGTYLVPGGARVQPDVCLYREGGRASIGAMDYLEGVPEFIAEISGSSADHDLREKLQLYERTGVAEYLVWRTEERRIDLFRLVGGTYVIVSADADGVLSSTSFPGLRFHITALLAGDLSAAIAEITRGTHQ